MIRPLLTVPFESEPKKKKKKHRKTKEKETQLLGSKNVSLLQCFSLFASLSKNVSHNPNTKHKKKKSNSYNKVESEQANMAKKKKNK